MEKERKFSNDSEDTAADSLSVTKFGAVKREMRFSHEVDNEPGETREVQESPRPRFMSGHGILIQKINDKAIF